MAPRSKRGYGLASARHRIVAPGSPRVTAAEPGGRHPSTGPDAMQPNGLTRVIGTTRQITALPPQHGRGRQLIGTDRPGHGRLRPCQAWKGAILAGLTNRARIRRVDALTQWRTRLAKQGLAGRARPWPRPDRARRPRRRTSAASRRGGPCSLESALARRNRPNAHPAPRRSPSACGAWCRAARAVRRDCCR